MSDSIVRAGVLGTGAYLPDRVLDNRELADRFGCSEEWILTRTGIRERRFANAAAATIPIALDEAVRDGRIQPGMNVLMTGFGAGLTWASTVVRWS